MKKDGALFHAKHAFMPNNLGYCGPDENERMLLGLEEGRTNDGLVRSLQKFEAAYPFLKLIARSTGRNVFDYSVPEAYWIGNDLLGRVPTSDFYSFSHRELPGRDRSRAREIFKELDGSAVPHHTFYVMSTYAASAASDGPDMRTEREDKLARLIDSCRISWGRVTGVRKKELEVLSRPVTLAGGLLSFAPTVKKLVNYNPEVSPFGSVKPGDVVSLHWNYACEILDATQQRNLTKYTRADLALVNRVLDSKRKA